MIRESIGAVLMTALMVSCTAESLPSVLWQAPGNITAEDWRCGPDRCVHTPAPPFEVIKEDASGTQPKVTVKDANGVTWSIKFGAEVIPECFCSRFLHALGYTAEPTYFVASGKIAGVHKLRRARRIVKQDGTFTKGRFEMRGQPDLVFLEGKAWSWVDNPFTGTHELAGLKIIMMLVSNWDAKDARDVGDSNNGVFLHSEAGTRDLRYAVFDWGASLGRWGGTWRRDQSDCAGFNADTPDFVKRIGPNRLQWGFRGKHWQDLTAGISVEDIRWLLANLRRIAPEQIQAGLSASGATGRQASCWTTAIENRIQQLRAAAE